MNKTIFLLAACLAISVPIGSLAASDPPAPAAPTAKAEPAATISLVPIYLSGSRSLAVLRVADHPPAPVVFDTGTSDNALDADYATRLRLRYDASVQVEVQDGTGNSFIAKQGLVPNAELGGVRISEKTATVYPYKEQDVVGIFGPGSFRGKYVLLDLGNGRLIVRDRQTLETALPPGIPYLGTSKDSALPAIDVQIAGITARAVLDSGNTSALLLPEEMAKTLPLKGPLRLAGTLRSVTGSRDFYEGDIVGEVRIGDVVLTNPTVRFSSDVVNVGLPVIRQLVVMLDPENRQSWIIGSAAPAERLAEYSGRYGIRTVRAVEGGLIYQRDGRALRRLRPLGADLFEIEATGDMVRFRRVDGQVVAFELFSPGGPVTRAEKN